MEKHPQQILEELIHRELAKLPERQAPDTLIPRVLEQIRLRVHKHWWQRPWIHWPFALQLASIPLMLTTIGGAIFGASVLWNYLLAGPDLGTVSDTLDVVASVWDFLGVLGNAVLVMARAAGQQWLLLALFIPLSMYLACVGLGTLFYRLAVSNR